MDKWKPKGFITYKVIDDAVKASGLKPDSDELDTYLNLEGNESIALFYDGMLPKWIEDHNNRIIMDIEDNNGK